MTKDQFNQLAINDPININDNEYRIKSINKDQGLLELGVITMNEFNRLKYMNTSWYRYENVDFVDKTTNINKFINFFG